jgi:hypothetical protein
MKKTESIVALAALVLTLMELGTVDTQLAHATNESSYKYGFKSAITKYSCLAIKPQKAHMLNGWDTRYDIHTPGLEDFYLLISKGDSFIKSLWAGSSELSSLLI